MMNPHPRCPSHYSLWSNHNLPSEAIPRTDEAESPGRSRTRQPRHRKLPEFPPHLLHDAGCGLTTLPIPDPGEKPTQRDPCSYELFKHT
ncbi:hypothetical protein BCR34DRAFT_387941 [Clohesyomyces aquaticus]|uniref:Uncharacterized protein n=1 Tax=Clohesyomyces aquaticus TaxID=1231657 RepID=A0A1Y1ZGB1_9PLEO|nr:hypothetical protein BCR34DRAFT_387941 [Clohesyomyces aquaticus]